MMCQVLALYSSYLFASLIICESEKTGRKPHPRHIIPPKLTGLLSFCLLGSGSMRYDDGLH